MHALLQKLEDTPKPVVMAMHGTALGGGLEVAMAGHYRVAVPDAQMGQPEVNLGIIPGAEGTQRLPRLVGLEKAIEMCVSGKPMKAADALSVGLIDRIIEGDLGDGRLGLRARDGGARQDRIRKRASGKTNFHRPVRCQACSPPDASWRARLVVISKRRSPSSTHSRLRPHFRSPKDAPASARSSSTSQSPNRPRHSSTHSSPNVASRRCLASPRTPLPHR